MSDAIKSALYLITYLFFSATWKVCTVIVLILQMRKLRHRQAKPPVQGHKANTL